MHLTVNKLAAPCTQVLFIHGNGRFVNNAQQSWLLVNIALTTGVPWFLGWSRALVTLYTKPARKQKSGFWVNWTKRSCGLQFTVFMAGCGFCLFCLQCFEAVGWVSERASCLYKM